MTVSDPKTTISALPSPYTAQATWSPSRPTTLVVCCSDGRLQESVDEFLSNSLGIVYYDRLYTPGGPGALSDLGSEFTRAHQYRTELEFLLKAHSFRKVILLFHGSAEDGPADSVCAHYRRLLPSGTHDDLCRRHEDDTKDVVRYLHDLSPNLEIQVLRAEVTSQLHVRFVELD